MDLFIYYQVPVAKAGAAEARVRAMQTALQAEHGIAGQLKCRPQAKDGLQTWMEIYAATSPAFQAALAAAVIAAGLPELISGSRHTEHFTDVLPCA